MHESDFKGLSMALVPQHVLNYSSMEKYDGVSHPLAAILEKNRDLWVLI
jgi:hypothetical protein